MPPRSRASAAAESPSGPPRGVVLVTGDEEFLVARALEDLIAHARAADPDAEIIERTGAQIAAAELAELLSPSLFGGARLFVVRSAQDVPVAAQPTLTAALADLPEDTAVVVQHAGGAKGKAVLTAAGEHASSRIVCERITGARDRAAFVRAEARRARAKIDADAVEAVLQSVGGNLRELSAVTAQLAGDSGGHITSVTVSAYHRGRAEVSGFDVADRALDGNLPAAMETLRWALSIGVPPVLIADALADGVRTVARVSGAGGGNEYALASRLGMPPWKVKQALRRVSAWSEPALRTALGIAADVNADVKGAAVDPGYALEKAVRRLAETRGGRH